MKKRFLNTQADPTPKLMMRRQREQREQQQQQQKEKRNGNKTNATMTHIRKREGAENRKRRMQQQRIKRMMMATQAGVNTEAVHLQAGMILQTLATATKAVMLPQDKTTATTTAEVVAQVGLDRNLEMI